MWHCWKSNSFLSPILESCKVKINRKHHWLIVSTNKWHQLKSAALLPYLTKATLKAKWIYLLNFSNKIWLWSSSNDHLILSNMKGYDANLYPFIAFTSLQELHKEGHLIWKFVTLLKWVSHHHLKCVSGN